MEPEDSLKNFNSLKQKVLEKRPVLKQLLKKKGGKNILEYSNQYIDINFNPTIPRRQNELLEVIGSTVEERFGKGKANSVVNQLKKYYFVSTADHTGPINHPFFLNSNLLIAASMLNHNDPALKNIIVLSCARISVDNSSFPRGLFFHNYQNEKLETHRLAFFSGNLRPPLIYNVRPYCKADLEKIYLELEVKLKKNEITNNQCQKLISTFKEVYDRPEFLNLPTYTEQISKTNFLLWKKFFPDSDTKLPDLIYLELEDIVAKLITKYHLTQDTIVNHILFDPEYEPYINTYFENIFGSFSRKESSGTYLFWALPPGARYNLQLWREGSFLVSKDRSYKIELTPEAIKEALIKKELIPGLLLDFMVVSFYYGLKCLGGFNQINYLTMMKNNYIKMNVDLENYRSIEICARAQTKELCDGPTIAYLGYNGEQQLTLASGLDLILYQDKNSWKTLIDLAKNITLEEALNPLLPEIYKISYDQKEWEENLTSITEKEITNLTGLNKKIKPCIFINDNQK